MADTIILFMGRSGSGKSTLERNLAEHYPELFHKIVSVTTRPKRRDEVDGVDYKFISDLEYANLDLYDELIQETSFGGFRYGSEDTEYLVDKPFATLCVIPRSVPDLIERLKKKYHQTNIVTVYFNLSEDKLREHMRKRFDAESYINERLAQDDIDKQYEKLPFAAEHIIHDCSVKEDLPEKFLEWLWSKHG